jgi:catechol 2,3-dioxygenase
VSEALYLRDPDGNGVELYWDRPKEQWPYGADGQLAMYSKSLDLAGLLAEEPELTLPPASAPAGTGPKDL